MGIPYAIVAGTSAGYTYASAKLDHQSYFRILRTERGFVEDAVLNRVFAKWLREWSLLHPEAPAPSDDSTALVSEWNASWLWPMFDNLDMLTAARVESIALKNKTTTLATEYARQGKNWKTELAQYQKERAYLKKLGIAD